MTNQDLNDRIAAESAETVRDLVQGLGKRAFVLVAVLDNDSDDVASALAAAGLTTSDALDLLAVLVGDTVDALHESEFGNA